MFFLWQFMFVSLFLFFVNKYKIFLKKSSFSNGSHQVITFWLLMMLQLLFESSLIDAGFEYASVHNSSYAGRRLTKSEYPASIFLELNRKQNSFTKWNSKGACKFKGYLICFDNKNNFMKLCRGYGKFPILLFSWTKICQYTTIWLKKPNLKFFYFISHLAQFGDAKSGLPLDK